MKFFEDKKNEIKILYLMIFNTFENSVLESLYRIHIVYDYCFMKRL